VKGIEAGIRDGVAKAAKEGLRCFTDIVRQVAVENKTQEKVEQRQINLLIYN
jgi:hypothetical protein